MLERDRTSGGAVANLLRKAAHIRNISQAHHNGRGMVSLHHLLPIPAVEQSKKFDQQMQFLAAQGSIANFTRLPNYGGILVKR
jgi:hypothetical protein